MPRTVKAATGAICGQPRDDHECGPDGIEKSKTGLLELRLVEITITVAQRHAKIGEMTSRQAEGPARRLRDHARHTLPRYENLRGNVRVEKRRTAPPWSVDNAVASYPHSMGSQSAPTAPLFHDRALGYRLRTG